MSRFTMAIDMEDWRATQRPGRTRRRKADKRRRREEGRRREDGRRGEDGRRREASAPPPARPAAPSRPRGQESRPEAELPEDELPEDELPDDELEDEDFAAEPARGWGRGQRRERREQEGARAWQRPVSLGERMRLQTRPGTRAAVVEVKPGLFVVAEVPVESVEFGFGPMLLAPALMKTLGRALQGRRSAGGAGRAHRPELSTPAPKQLPGPTADAPETSGLASWLDRDLAAELGCPCELPVKRRRA